MTAGSRQVDATMARADRPQGDARAGTRRPPGARTARASASSARRSRITTTVRERLVGLRRVRRQRGRERPPRPRAEVRGRPGARPTARPGRRRRAPSPPCPPRARAGAAGRARASSGRRAPPAGPRRSRAVSVPPTTAIDSSKPPWRDVEDRARIGRCSSRVEQPVAEPATRDGAGDRGDGDEQEVVGAQVVGLVAIRRQPVVGGTGASRPASRARCRAASTRPTNTTPRARSSRGARSTARPARSART